MVDVTKPETFSGSFVPEVHEHKGRQFSRITMGRFDDQHSAVRIARQREQAGKGTHIVVPVTRARGGRVDKWVVMQASDRNETFERDQRMREQMDPFGTSGGLF